MVKIMSKKSNSIEIATALEIGQNPNENVNPDGPSIDDVAAQAAKSITCGIYEIYANDNGEKIYIGSSTRIETCVKDYISWAVKGKAPKTIQGAYDRMIQTGIVVSNMFEWKLLEECTKDGLSALKVKYGLVKAGKTAKATINNETEELPVYTPVVESEVAAKKRRSKNGPVITKTVAQLEAEQAEQDETKTETEQAGFEDENTESEMEFYKKLYDEYTAGKPVKLLCIENDIKAHVFYKKIKQFAVEGEV